ncbi:hypothetical protein WA538_000410 [Blastocystis sp. DL]
MDSAIKTQFDRCEAEGLCRSDVAGLRMKWIPGQKHLIAQYHPTWQLVKRKASFQKPTMTQPFNPDGFNFTKVKESEVLARVYVKDRKVVFVRDSSDPLPEGVDTLYTILLNVSPICNNHQLLVPNLEKCYNQVWRYDLTENWIVFCENSERDDYVLFFNSLCGFSSVNHLHLQVMYSSSFYATATGSPTLPLPDDFTPSKLPLEYADCRVLFKREFVVCSEVKDWLSQAIKLSIEHDANETAEMGDRKRRELAHCFNELIRACYEQAFPYDVVFCQHGSDIYTFIRRYQQPLEDLHVNPACVELTGVVVYRSEESFDRADQDILMEECKKVVYFEPSIWDDFVRSYVNRIVNN